MSTMEKIPRNLESQLTFNLKSSANNMPFLKLLSIFTGTVDHRYRCWIMKALILNLMGHHTILLPFFKNINFLDISLNMLMCYSSAWTDGFQSSFSGEDFVLHTTIGDLTASICLSGAIENPIINYLRTTTVQVEANGICHG